MCMYMRHRITQFLIIFSSLLSLVHLTILHIIGLISLHTVLTLITQRYTTPHFAFISLSIVQCVDVYIVCGDYFSIGDGQANICGMIGVC